MLCTHSISGAFRHHCLRTRHRGGACTIFEEGHVQQKQSILATAWENMSIRHRKCKKYGAEEGTLTKSCHSASVKSMGSSLSSFLHRMTFPKSRSLSKGSGSLCLFTDKLLNSSSSCRETIQYFVCHNIDGAPSNSQMHAFFQKNVSLLSLRACLTSLARVVDMETSPSLKTCKLCAGSAAIRRATTR